MKVILMKNKIKPVVILMLVSILLITGCANEALTGNEWLLAQEDFYEDLHQICLEIDDVFSLYLIGSMGTKDFQNELVFLNIETTACQKQYEQQNAKIKPGSHSFASKIGMEALDHALSSIQSFLNICGKNIDDTEELARSYIEFKDNILTDVAAYVTARDLILYQEGESN